jgi:hypothetical protein
MQVSAEDAQRVLKDLMFDLWRADDCEERADTLKMLALVDFYLPFLPLERPHIERLFELKLHERRDDLIKAKEAMNLIWDEDVIQFLTDRVICASDQNDACGLLEFDNICQARGDRVHGILIKLITAPSCVQPASCAACVQVDFEGPYPIEGAKEVSTLMTRHVSRALRSWKARQRPGQQVALQPPKKKAELKPLVARAMNLVSRIVPGHEAGRKEDRRELPLGTVRLRVAKSSAGLPKIMAELEKKAPAE